MQLRCPGEFHRRVAVCKPCLQRRRSSVHLPKPHLTVPSCICTWYFMLNISVSKDSLRHTLGLFEWGKTSFKIVVENQKVPTLLPISPTLNFSLWRKFCVQVSVSEMSDFKDRWINHIPNHFCCLPGNLPSRYLGRKKSYDLKRATEGGHPLPRVISSNLLLPAEDRSPKYRILLRFLVCPASRTSSSSCYRPGR